MIRVGILTTWGDRCGTSEHARHIVEHAVDPEISIHVVTTPVSAFAQTRAKTFDIVHVNESGWILQGFKNEHIGMIRQTGAKVLLTMNASCPTNNKNPYTSLFDQVVIFESHTNDGYAYVPIGAPVSKWRWVPEKTSKFVGTNGFPQPRKNLLNLAEACEEMGWSLMSFGPQSPHADAGKVASEIRARNPSAICRTDWVTDQEMISYMSQCKLACYPYLEWFQGSSSAAMAGVSARVPLMVSRCSQFDFLFSSDEVYFIESARPTKTDIVSAFKKFEADTVKKVPDRLYEEHRWDRVGHRYVEVYKGMMKS